MLMIISVKNTGRDKAAQRSTDAEIPDSSLQCHHLSNCTGVDPEYVYITAQKLGPVSTVNVQLMG